MISNTVGKRSAVAKIAVYFLHEKKKGISLRSNLKPHMKKLLSTKYSAAAFNIAMLILRIGACGLMIPHGYDKLIHFTSYKAKFMNFLGMGPTLSLALVVFAEFFCALFVLIGLFSRLACIPVIVAMCVALNILDGSGLSPQNRVTAHSLVKVLQFARQRSWYQSFYHSLPVYNGMKIKSGSIGGARSFAGYHTSSKGDQFIVAIIVNNYDGSSTDIVRKMYKVLDVLK